MESTVITIKKWQEHFQSLGLTPSQAKIAASGMAFGFSVCRQDLPTLPTRKAVR